MYTLQIRAWRPLLARCFSRTRRAERKVCHCRRKSRRNWRHWLGFKPQQRYRYGSRSANTSYLRPFNRQCYDGKNPRKEDKRTKLYCNLLFPRSGSRYIVEEQRVNRSTPLTFTNTMFMDAWTGNRPSSSWLAKCPLAMI